VSPGRRRSRPFSAAPGWPALFEAPDDRRARRSLQAVAAEPKKELPVQRGLNTWVPGFQMFPAA
jgi:hypothetical protein